MLIHEEEDSHCIAQLVESLRRNYRALFQIPEQLKKFNVNTFEFFNKLNAIV